MSTTCSALPSDERRSAGRGTPAVDERAARPDVNVSGRASGVPSIASGGRSVSGAGDGERDRLPGASATATAAVAPSVTRFPAASSTLTFETGAGPSVVPG